MIDFRLLAPERRYLPALAFSPDGTAVAYSCNASGQYNLWLHPITQGEPRQLTRFCDRSVRQIAFSPNGHEVAINADRHGSEQYQICLVPLGGGDPKTLTPGEAQHRLAAAPFSIDGNQLAYAANDRDPAAQDSLIVDLTDGTTRRFQTRREGVLEVVGFAPDGKHLLLWCIRANTDSDLFLLDCDDSTGALECLTGHTGDEQHLPGPWVPNGSGLYEITDAGRDHRALVFHDLAKGTRTLLDTPDWDVEQVVLSADGTTLAWTVNDEGCSLLRVRQHEEALEPPQFPPGEVRSLAVSSDGRYLAFLLDSATRPTEVCVIDLQVGDFTYLTDSRPRALTTGDVTAIGPRLVRYPTHDRRTIPAYEYRPPGQGPFPVVLSIHGGPEDQERPVYRYAGLYQYLLAAGVAVLAPNVRGSTGYGAIYQRLIHRDWGGGELGDLEHAAQYLQDQPWVDPHRIAVFGGSFGGFAALSCLARLPRYWAAGVSVVGQSNLISFARSVPPTWRPLMTRWVGDPDIDAALLTERSPLTYAEHIEAPLFVIQGARDPRVVKAESDQIVATVRARGVEVRYDVYEDEGHGFTNRDNEIKAWRDVGDFLIDKLRSRP